LTDGLTDQQRLVLYALPWDDGNAFVSVEDLPIIGVSSNAAATRLSELQEKGLAVGRYRSGKRFKEWARRREPVAPRLKQPKPRFRVSAVERTLLGGLERVVLEVPAGALRPGQELRLA
jgi:hypothetical protein